MIISSACGKYSPQLGRKMTYEDLIFKIIFFPSPILHAATNGTDCNDGKDNTTDSSSGLGSSSEPGQESGSGSGTSGRPPRNPKFIYPGESWVLRSTPTHITLIMCLLYTYRKIYSSSDSADMHRPHAYNYAACISGRFSGICY